MKDPGKDLTVISGKVHAILFAPEAALDLVQNTVQNAQKALNLFTDAAVATLSGQAPVVQCLQANVIQNVQLMSALMTVL